RPGLNIKTRVTNPQVSHLIVTPVTAKCQTAICFPAEIRKAFNAAVKQDYSRRMALTIQHTLWSFPSRDAIVQSGIHVRRRMVDPYATTSIHFLPVQQNAKP